MYVYHVCAPTEASQMHVSDPLEPELGNSCEPPSECGESNLGPQGEPPML